MQSVTSCSLFLGSCQDEEINQQSQLAEKLKQQMLDQEEVSAGGLMCLKTKTYTVLSVIF